MAQSRARAVYMCGACGQQAPRWLGRCPSCGEWGTVAEEAPPAVPPAPRWARRRRRRGWPSSWTTAPERLATGIGELDRVLGGGLVPGSLVLIGGEPGIGKSTLVLQALASLAAPERAMLVTGEESPVQVRGRAERLQRRLRAPSGCSPRPASRRCSRRSRRSSPQVCAVNSVQTLHSDAVDGAPGAPNQVRQVTVELMRVAKERGVTILLVGQVTKDGGLAGPRTLEHLVNCVLSFEGDDLRAHRVLRATKNRFGSTNETGVFEMGASGLESVDDPTRLYLAEAGDAGRLVRLPGHRGQPRAAGRGPGARRPTEVVPPRRVAVGRRPHAPGPDHRRALAARRAAARATPTSS